MKDKLIILKTFLQPLPGSIADAMLNGLIADAEDLEKRADIYDKIESAVGRFYSSKDDDELSAESEGNLCEIGEEVASILGYL
jgi:hypothetical protein